EESPGAASAPRGAAGALRALLVMLARENLLLATSMGAITFVAQGMEELPAEPVSPLVVALVFYAVYTLDRAGDADADDLTHPERARFSRRNARRMRAASLGAYALALALAATRGGWAVAVALLPLAALLLYSFRIVPSKIARRAGFARIKEVFVLKNVWVAATLAGTATLLPIAAAGAAPRWPAAAAMGGFLFGRWWINTLVFDLRDEAGDRANGLRTVPVALGRARTLRLLHAGNAALAAATLAVPLLGWARPLFALLAASSVYACLYLRALAAGGDPHFLCDVVADGELLLLSALVLLATL
ncbi:MAG TPA: UbiA family prenyltransferase, partial [Longimicrobium sp.]|nr:UbiA family prenyltransferase [Longimicrobium sp.]